MDDIELAEQYTVLLLGAQNKGVPSLIHLHKELFVLSQAIDSVKEVFHFQKHYFGPFSPILNELVDSPFSGENVFTFDNEKIQLSEQGIREYKRLCEVHSDNKRFASALQLISLVREIYDKLSKNELLFLIYETYPEYTELSDVYQGLCKNRESRERILHSLISKGTITRERYNELI